MIDYIIVGIVIAALAVVIFRMVRRSKAGGGCAGCSACAHSTAEHACGGCAEQKKQ